MGVGLGLGVVCVVCEFEVGSRVREIGNCNPDSFRTTQSDLIEYDISFHSGCSLRLRRKHA